MLLLMPLYDIAHVVLVLMSTGTAYNYAVAVDGFQPKDPRLPRPFVHRLLGLVRKVLKGVHG